ncbi:Magnesium and cobalt efflux protein CorC [compost metagenome]
MEIIIIFFLTLLNGFFALSEIALVSVKRSRMEHLALQGKSSAKTVLGLLENPEHFLSSVQVGITLIGIISGAYGGATLTDNLEQYVVQFNALKPHAHTVSLIIVIGAITYFSIVIGELVPKSIAMNNAERIALFCAPIIKVFTSITFPFVKLLSVSTTVILKVFRIKDNGSDTISEDELRFMLKTAGTQGVLEKEESEVHQNLFSFTDQIAKTLMTHSSELEWIDVNDSAEEIYDKVMHSAHSKFPVCDGDIDQVLGFMTIRDFLGKRKDDDFKLNNILQEPIFISGNTPAFTILNLFKKHKKHLAFVVDEYGAIKGMITLHDLTEAIVGDLPDEDEIDDQDIFAREDGSLLLNGKTSIYDLNQYLNKEIIENRPNRYTTISGFIIYNLKRLPQTGDVFVHENYRFEIIDMDGRKVDKILMVAE